MTELHPDVIAMARAGEPERYVAATLSPAPVRVALIALAAFSADLRRVSRLVKEPVMGEVRLQWWRDCIESFKTGEATGHPIADALAAAVREHGLPIASLVAMTEARAFDLYDDPMPDEAAFTGYLTKTEALPFALTQKVLAGADTPDICMLAARAYGFARVLALLPAAVSRHRMPLPATLLAAHGVDLERTFSGQSSPELERLLRQCCDDILTAFGRLREATAARPRPDLLAMLPSATVPAYVRALQRPGRNPLREVAEISPLARVMQLGRARWLGL